jgi:hypothetical protein
MLRNVTVARFRFVRTFCGAHPRASEACEQASLFPSAELAEVLPLSTGKVTFVRFFHEITGVTPQSESPLRTLSSPGIPSCWD